MKKYFKLLLCTCLLGVVASSCSNKDEEIDPAKYMPISNVVAGPENMTVLPGGDTLRINVEAKAAWTAVADADWVVADKLSGEGPATIKVYAKPNTGTADRAATVKVTSAGKTSVINISQSAEYYTSAKLAASFDFSLPDAAWFKLNIEGDVETVKMYAVSASAVSDMSVSDKLSYVTNYGETHHYAIVDESLDVLLSYSGLNEDTEYTLLLVGADKDGRYGTPVEVLFKTPAPCKTMAELTDITLDEQYWTVTSTPAEFPGYYLIRVSDVVSLYDAMKDGSFSTMEIALMIRQMTQGTDYPGVECRYVEAGEEVLFERTRKDPTKNVDGSLFISWCATEDFSQTSTRYYYREVYAGDFVNK